VDEERDRRVDGKAVPDRIRPLYVVVVVGVFAIEERAFRIVDGIAEIGERPIGAVRERPERSAC